MSWQQWVLAIWLAIETIGAPFVLSRPRDAYSTVYVSFSTLLLAFMFLMAVTA